MAEQTIEFEETVTKEETVTICDECGREQDEHGIDFEAVEYVRRDAGDMPRKLHYCSECVAEMDDSWTPEYVERADDWLQTKDGSGWTVEENIRAVRWGLVLEMVAVAAIGILIQPLTFAVFIVLVGMVVLQALLVLFATDALNA